MSQSGGESMPFVFSRQLPDTQKPALLHPETGRHPGRISEFRGRGIRFRRLSGLIAAIVLILFGGGRLHAMPHPLDEGADESAETGQDQGQPDEGAEGAAAVNYSEAIEKQQQWTRDLRNMSKPLLEGDYEAEYVKIRSAYNSLLSSGGNLNSGRDLEVLQKALELRILRAADPAVQQDAQLMKDVLEQVRRELARAGGAITNAQTKQRFRQDYCREVMKVLKKLLDNNWEARSFALSLMPDLEVVPAGFNVRRVEVFDEVPGVLLGVLTDGENQPDSIHMRAAAEISRFLRKTDSPPLEQMKLASGLASELQRSDTEIAYQLELVRALSHISQPREVVGRPVPTALAALVDAMSDTQRHILVRCEAAKGIGRAGFDAQINFEPLAWKTVQLSVQAGAIYNQQRNPQMEWVFSLSGADLYFAFHHEDADFKTGRNPQGMLNRAPRSQIVNDAYQQVLRIAPRMWFGESIPNADLLAVNKWVNENVPDNMTWDTNAPALQK